MISEARRELDRRLVERLLADHVDQAAIVVEQLSLEHGAALLADLSPEGAARLLQVLQRNVALALLRGLDGERIGAILGQIEPLAAALLLRQCTAGEQATLLATTDERRAHLLRRCLRHPDDSALALMNTQVLSAAADVTVEQVRRQVAAFSPADGVADDYLYVVGRNETLQGVVGLVELLRAPLDAELSALMRTSVLKISATLDREAVISHPGWLRFRQLPVVDRQNVLLGAIDARTWRRLDTEASAARQPASLGLSIAELYWGFVARLVEGAMGASPPPAEGPTRRRLWSRSGE